MPLKLLLLLVVLAPVPAATKPDPLGLGYLGVRPSLPDASGSDLTLTEVQPGTPAARGGLQVGDTVVRIGRLTPTRFEEARDYILGTRPGTRLEVVVKRGGRTVNLAVVVGAKVLDPRLGDPFDPNGVLRMPAIPPNR